MYFSSCERWAPADTLTAEEFGPKETSWPFNPKCAGARGHLRLRGALWGQWCWTGQRVRCRRVPLGAQREKPCLSLPFSDSKTREQAVPSLTAVIVTLLAAGGDTGLKQADSESGDFSGHSPNRSGWMSRLSWTPVLKPDHPEPLLPFLVSSLSPADGEEGRQQLQ